MKTTLFRKVLKCLSLVLSIIPFFLFNESRLLAHGFEGDRFFPPTITLDDPFATDDSVLTVSSFNSPANSSGPLAKTMLTSITAEVDKEIFPKFAIGVSKSYNNLQPEAGVGSNGSSGPLNGPGFSFDGFQNFQLSLKYQAWENPEHEALVSFGTYIDLGGSSFSSGLKPSRSQNQMTASYDSPNSFSTYSPTIWWGKGLGDLPDTVRFLRPIAVTGVISQNFPTESSDGFGDAFSNSLNWGFSLEYSLPYLETQVEDLGIPAPIRDVIPCVEFALNTPENNQVGAGSIVGTSHTVGTINPGFMWEGKYCQVGAEAIIPVNSTSGPDVGAVFQVHIYIDDLFPHFFGHPLIPLGSNSDK